MTNTTFSRGQEPQELSPRPFVMPEPEQTLTSLLSPTAVANTVLEFGSRVLTLASSSAPAPHCWGGTHLWYRSRLSLPLHTVSVYCTTISSAESLRTFGRVHVAQLAWEISCSETRLPDPDASIATFSTGRLERDGMN